MAKTSRSDDDVIAGKDDDDDDDVDDNDADIDGNDVEDVDDTPQRLSRPPFCSLFQTMTMPVESQEASMLSSGAKETSRTGPE